MERERAPVRSALRWLDRQADWLEATPAEVAGLTVLLVGAALAAVVVWWTAIPRPVAGLGAPDGGPAVTVEDPPAEPLLVHVGGAVGRPGVVRLEPGARVGDAIAAAGGARPDAVLDGLNLARPLNDGEQVLVPDAAAVDAGPAAGPSGAAPGGAWRPDGRLDINRATVGDLEELPGIGPVLAQRIVDHRDEHGPFSEVGELRDVPGIGEATFQRIAELVTV